MFLDDLMDLESDIRDSDSHIAASSYDVGSFSSDIDSILGGQFWQSRRSPMEAQLNLTGCSPTLENYRQDFDHSGGESASAVESATLPTTGPLEFCDPRALNEPLDPLATNDSAKVLPMGPPNVLSKTGGCSTMRKIPRLPNKAVLPLQDWLDRHHKNPYPTASEKKKLSRVTNLSVKQVTDWFSRARSRNFGKKAKFLSSNIGQSPMQRYLESPPKDEPASLEAIRNAAESVLWKEPDESMVAKHGNETPWTPPDFSFEEQAASDRGYDSVTLSGLSSGSMCSFGSHASHASWAGRKGRKKHREHQDAQRLPHESGKYQCTWCSSTFHRPSDWQRHEESQHAPQVEWVCLFGTDPEEENCVFCGEMNPSLEHYNTRHNASQCFSKPIRERSFDRKDHLLQHIRQVHRQVPVPSIIKTWANPIANNVPPDGWRCGFCHSRFFNWRERVTHIRAHFDSGLDMESWDLSSTSISLSRVSRYALQSSNVYGCSECCRCFTTREELIEHERLPHLVRSEWTCSDAYSSLLSEIPEFSKLTVGNLLPEERQTECRHCHWSQAPSLTFESCKKRIREHFLLDHDFGSCQLSFSDPWVLRDHLLERHKIRPFALVRLSVVGHLPVEIPTGTVASFLHYVSRLETWKIPV